MRPPLRVGARSKPGRPYSTETPAAPAPESAKLAEGPGSLEALRAEFYAFQNTLLNWNVGGVAVPKAVLWLALFQLLGLAPYSYYLLEQNESVAFLREHVDTVQRMTEGLQLPLGEDGGDDHWRGRGFTVNNLPSWERAAINSVTSIAVLSGIAFFWARRRTRRCFNSFILSRALGESTGTYPIGLENVVRKGDALKIKGEALKIVRNEVVRLAGLKAVQASAVLLLASTISSYALNTWVASKVRDDVIRFRRRDAVQAEVVLSGFVLLDLLLSWAVLLYQPYTIFPFVISNLLVPLLPARLRPGCKQLAMPGSDKAVVTEHTTVTDVEGGKEYITVTEKRTGNSVSRTETRVFVADRDSADWDSRPLEPRRKWKQGGERTPALKGAVEEEYGDVDETRP